MTDYLNRGNYTHHVLAGGFAARLALMLVVAATAASGTSSTVELSGTPLDEHCDWDGRPGCNGGEGVAAPATAEERLPQATVFVPHSMLQVSHPKRTMRSKVQLHQTLEEPRVARVRSSDQEDDDLSGGGMVREVSFLQVAETTFAGAAPDGAAEAEAATASGGAQPGHAAKEATEPAGTREVGTQITSDSDDTEKAVGDISLAAASSAGHLDQVYAARRGMVNMALMTTVTVLLVWSACLLMYTCSRQCVKRLACLRRVMPSEQVATDSAAPGAPSVLKDSLLPDTEVSFAIPLTHYTAVGINHSFSFDLQRQPDGLPVVATVSCQPEGNVFAKVELSTRRAAGSTVGSNSAPSTTLASCRLVQSGADDESSDMQGAMLSWLSLLLHEKSAEAVVEAEQAGRGEDAVSPTQQPKVRVCLYGVAEELRHLGIGTPAARNLRLEMHDGSGSAVGVLEPGLKPCRYTLVHHGGKPSVEIKADPDSRSIAVEKQGQTVALANDLGGGRNPDLPELTGEEDEHLQVDIAVGVDWADTCLYLTCILAMVVFNPKADMAQEDQKIPKSSDHISKDSATGTNAALVQNNPVVEDYPPLHARLDSLGSYGNTWNA